MPKLITCKDESHQDEQIIEKVLDHYEQGIQLRKQAVLFRAASHSATLEIALMRRNIPFVKYGGLRFLETAHIKDLVSILRIAENPRDEIAWFRVLKLIPGVGPRTAASIFEHVAEHHYDPVSIASYKTPTSIKEHITLLTELMSDLSRMSPEVPSACEQAHVFSTIESFASEQSSQLIFTLPGGRVGRGSGRGGGRVMDGRFVLIGMKTLSGPDGPTLPRAGE